MDIRCNYTVYCHINKVNGKTYVGITSSAPELRWKNGEGYKNCRKFYNAILKEAEQATGVKASYIRRYLRGERNLAGGFVWKKIEY